MTIVNMKIIFPRQNGWGCLFFHGDIDIPSGQTVSASITVCQHVTFVLRTHLHTQIYHA